MIDGTGATLSGRQRQRLASVRPDARRSRARRGNEHAAPQPRARVPCVGVPGCRRAIFIIPRRPPALRGPGAILLPGSGRIGRGGGFRPFAAGRGRFAERVHARRAGVPRLRALE